MDIKKAGLLMAMVLAVILAILTYWSQHLYYSAAKIQDDKSKVDKLSGARSIYPLNDLVFFELGKAYFDMGIQTLYDTEGPNIDYFQKSLRNLEQSLRINPVSYLGHFYYAQSIYLMDHLAPASEVDFYAQYKKSALLAGHDIGVFYEVGKVFLSKWEDLSEEDREFTQEILSEALLRVDGEKFEDILHVWEMNVKYYTVIQRIIPEDAQFFRIYAEFLGEKSLSRDERIRFLSMAEQIEFEQAQNEYAEGNKEMARFRLDAAAGHYQACLQGLGRIRLYQDLGGEILIDPETFIALKKSANLEMAKAMIRQERSLSEVEDNLRSYLDLEDRISEINDLEIFLQNQGVIADTLELRAGDMNLLAFQVFLYFKQARYREIAGFEKLLKQSFVAVPTGQTEGYVRILQLIGNAAQRTGALYGAIDFYNEALEIDPDNLESLLGIRTVRERMNDDDEVREINRRIQGLLSPMEIELENPGLDKRKPVTRRLILDGRSAALELEMGEWGEELVPFLSVVFNGLVIWEGYPESQTISIPVLTKIGDNTLRIESLNRDAIITAIRYN
jgi:tetratricopeptide (TPR) repeat protein